MSDLKNKPDPFQIEDDAMEKIIDEMNDDGICKDCDGTGEQRGHLCKDCGGKGHL